MSYRIVCDERNNDPYTNERPRIPFESEEEYVRRAQNVYTANVDIMIQPRRTVKQINMHVQVG